MNTSESGVQFCPSLCHAVLSGIALQTGSRNWTSEIQIANFSQISGYTSLIH